MAGKRHSGTLENMMYNKFSRVEMSPQCSITCLGKTTPKDLQACKNFLTYSLPGTEIQSSASPWNSAAAYQQYAGNALNQHFQTSGVSVKCQRPEVEMLRNPLQLSDNANNHFSVQQNHPIHSYHISPPRACPPIAMPRPVYRSPSGFVDAAYGTQGFQSLGVCVGSQPLCPPAMEWNSSTRFAYSSSPLYAPGSKKHFSTPSNYPEVAGSLSSHSRGIQEQSPVHRHRMDVSLAVGVSPTCPQEDVFTDHCQSFDQPNVELLYAEGTVPVGRQRSSAFNVPSHQHQNYKPSPYQGSLDSRMGNLYSKSHYSNTMDGIHQRSSPFSCSMDMATPPHSVKGGTIYPSRVQKMHPGYVNTELRVRPSQNDGNLQINPIWAERDLQIGTAKTNTEVQVCSSQRDKDLWVGSEQVNRGICVGSTTVDKERLFDASRCLQERNIYGDRFTEKSSHVSFHQQNSSSNITPVVSTNSMLANQHARASSITSKMSTLHSLFHSFEGSTVTGVSLEQHDRHTSNKRTNLNAECIPSDSSGVVGQYQKSDDNLKMRKTDALLDPDCDLPAPNVVDVDGRKSPPMPVINDVFSLAPYCDYLEGKVHNFPTHQGCEVENKASSSLFSQQPLSPDRTDKDGQGNITEVINAECPQAVKIQQTEILQTGEPQDVSFHQTGVETAVLDLSLKRSLQTSSSACGQEGLPHHDQEALPHLVNDNCPTKTPERKLHQDQEICKTLVARKNSHTGQESVPSQTTGTMFSPRKESCDSQATDRMSCLGPESYLSTKSFFYHGQENPLSQATETQHFQLRENCPTRATESLSHQLQEKSLSQATESLPCRHQESYPSQVTETLPCQHQENYPSQATKSLPHQLSESYPSLVTESLPLQLQENYSSHATKRLPHQLQERYKSQATESLSHQFLENYTSLLTKIMPHQGQSRCMSQVSRPLPVNASAACSSQPSNLSLFVGTIQTSTTFLPQSVLLASSPAVFSPKNLILHSPQQKKSLESSGRRARNSFDSCRSINSPSGSENEANGFHSSKSFMFRKYKMMKFSSSGGETQEASCDSVSHSLPSPFPLPSDAVQSLPPSAPESSPTLGEANVSLASVGELAPSGSGQQFSELHRSVRTAITTSVSRSPSSLLEDWLAKTKEEERSKTPVKTKNASRTCDHNTDSPGRDVWLAFDGVRLLLHKLLSQLETFMFTRSCPFPHAIRAGAVFIPIHLVKEVLFPELLGPSVDRILQKHKVELRPTTLSEEKLLRETELKDCPSRMLKLLALKQLPDVYPDLLHLFCGHTMQQQLDNVSKKGLEKEDCQLSNSSKEEPKIAPPKKGKSPLILKLQRVCKHSGNFVYKAQRLRPPEKRGADKLQKIRVCRNKSYRERRMFTYKKRRRGRRKCNISKSFPDLVGRRILHLFDDGEQEVWFPGKVQRVHQRSRNPRDTQYEVWYDDEPGTRYFLELLQDYEKGWLQLDN